MKCFQPVYIIRYFLPKVKFIFARVGFGNGWRLARDRPSPYQTGAGFSREDKISKIRSRICRIFKISRRGAGDCSFGSACSRMVQDPAILPYRGDARTCAPGHGEGQALALRAAARCFHRSAGACPPRLFDLRENHPPAKAVSRVDRGTARDRPSPYSIRVFSLNAQIHWISANRKT